jgi:hypothetical protein
VIRIALSAASGIKATMGAARSATVRSTSEWMMAATGVRAPLRIFAAVRAIAPVAAMPPTSGEKILAIP